MKNEIPSRPDLLGDFLAKVLAGANKHQQDGVLSEELIAKIQAAMANLASHPVKAQLSKGQYQTDKKDLRDVVQSAKDVATRARDAVYLKYGHKDEVLVDFSLTPPRKKGKGVTVAASKAAKANDLVAKTQARLEKARLRMSQLEAQLAKRQVDAAHAALALPTEPTPVSEPTPSSNK